jgi:hypothetical protein
MPYEPLTDEMRSRIRELNRRARALGSLDCERDEFLRCPVCHRELIIEEDDKYICEGDDHTVVCSIIYADPRG